MVGRATVASRLDAPRAKRQSFRAARNRGICKAGIRSQIDTFVPGREISPSHGKWSGFPASQTNKTSPISRDVQDTERVITERKVSLHCR
jgi:hypothetical protein